MTRSRTWHYLAWRYVWHQFDCAQCRGAMESVMSAMCLCHSVLPDGRRRPFDCCSLGGRLLADMSDDERNAIGVA